MASSTTGARAARIRAITHTMLDRMERVVAAITRRYPPPAYHLNCPKSACRRARGCRRVRHCRAP